MEKVEKFGLNFFPVSLFYFFIGILKFTAILLMIVFFILHHELVKIFIWNSDRRLRYYLKDISFMSWLALKILNVRVNLQNKQLSKEGRLLVSNHLSYLDALILFAYYPSLFITSIEVRDTFLLGRLCKLGGCFFIERRKSMRGPDTVAKEIAAIKSKLDQNFDIFLFPEGTSSNGKTVLPFKTAFFQAAIDCQRPVTPLCLQYNRINGAQLSADNADTVCWYGDMTFPDHLFRLCLQKNIVASIQELDSIQISSESERHQIGELAHKLIGQTYRGY